MTMTRAILRTLFRTHRGHAETVQRPAAGRSVMMRVTLDAQHVTPLRRALTRDCAGQPWTIRIAALPHSGRVQLSLYLPKDALNGAIEQVARIAPAAQVGHVFEIPDTPTDGWRDLLRGSSWAHALHSPKAKAQAPVADETQTLGHLLSAGNVLLDAGIANRAALFARLGERCSARYGVAAHDVVTGLMARESLGSTGLGQGIAVPHSQIAGLGTPVAMYVRPGAPLDFDAPDGKPVSDVIALFVPEGAHTMHLNLLADVAQRFCDHHFRERLHACGSADEVCRLFTIDDAGIDGTDMPSPTPMHRTAGARLRASPYSQRSS
jgi:nitrogen PTS system EIIA component